ncbi:monovalent cation/H+ antiporter subunit D family protein [Haloferax sp. Atlit-10N]|uniref:Monovalent cation/H+ antiporter subunit D n=1 Tax=Haloferax prahovense (strain DSM 18310 / JCM 13924 / TL6) TaxID=1227461 RepID=M0GJJ7_HALPT|nr:MULTISPECIES: monovalent cation/H+ antiporter subunit D family protein [Haloferax]ELZ72426.1 monovalent cation/H+ antiporter subunit D [Haloferax prahovense DSM 18310]RDZ45923.1 monovalent cation/H+ antiporter subunit D family protein [Haloferax sp. Atlit-19N]RDZ46805.1 monovalent cation/H+ antiporter subunit D family protein [Haloferax sp. Atlit-16N]RDZ60637.1 monovalent cation/H+ antiporter subunit D family protein [Haloferax sp. Atlit-10N]
MTDALVLLVVVPIAASLFPVVLGGRFERIGWFVAAAMGLVHLGLSATVAARVLDVGRISYAVGGFEPPFGIELVADGISAPLLVLVSLSTLGVLAYARRAGPHSNAFYSELALLTAGISGVFATADVFNLYVFLEITGLATYALVASGRSPSAALASLKYLFVGTIGASLYLLGVGYLYIMTGTLNMADLTEAVAAVGYTSPAILTSFGLIVTGLLVKVAVFPLHTWQPGAYAESPDTVSAYISALVSTAAGYALVRIIYAVYTTEFLDAVPLASDALVALASVSIVVGAVLAVMQSDLKRMLAYSSVSQFGLVVAAIGLANETALVGAVVHLVGHAVMKGGLFLTVGVFATGLGVRTVEDFAGLAAKAPVSSAAFAVLAFSMVGIPPAVGFVGKWNIVVGAVEAGAWSVAAVVVVSTLLTLAYFGRVIERMYFTAPEPEADAVSTDGGNDAVEVSFGMRAVVVASAVAAVVLGVLGSDLIAVIQPALEVYF